MGDEIDGLAILPKVSDFPDRPVGSFDPDRPAFFPGDPLRLGFPFFLNFPHFRHHTFPFTGFGEIHALKNVRDGFSGPRGRRTGFLSRSVGSRLRQRG